MTVLDTIFGQMHHVTTGQESARAVLIFAYGLLLVRISGRRSFGKWSALDIVVSIILGSSLSRALTGGAPLVGTLVACAVLLILHRLAAKAAAYSLFFSKIFEGRTITIVQDGTVFHQTMKKHSVSLVDLDEALRQADIDELDDVRFALLEPSGKFSVVKENRAEAVGTSSA